MTNDIRERFFEIERRLRSRLFVSIGLLLVLIAPPIYSLAPFLNEHLEVKSMQRHRERAERVAKLIAEQSQNSLAPQNDIAKLFYSSLLSEHGALLIIKNGKVEAKLSAKPSAAQPPPLGGKYMLPAEQVFGESGSILYERPVTTPQGEYELIFLAESVPYSAADRLARLDLLSLALAFSLGLVLVLWSYRGSLQLARSQHELALSLAHEIRTPLASMRLYSEMLSDGVAANEEQRQRFQSLVLAGTEKLSLVVDRLLALNVDLKPADLELLNSSQVLEALRVELEPFLLRANVNLELNAVDSSGLKCRCDVATLRQIFLIFADNAVKHGVNEDARLVQLAAHESRLFWRKRMVFSLRDFGAARDKASHKQKGLGLGLRIANRLARSMGAVTHILRRKPGREAQLILRVAEG